MQGPINVLIFYNSFMIFGVLIKKKYLTRSKWGLINLSEIEKT